MRLSSGRPHVKSLLAALGAQGRRLCEMCGAILALLIVGPVMCTCAVLIKLSGPGPVMLRLACLDEAGRVFNQLRFRTVHMDANMRRFRANCAQEAEGALTGVGAFLIESGLNKLPQLLNILAGQMSFFGPRAVALGTAVGHITLAKPGLFHHRDAKLSGL